MYSMYQLYRKKHNSHYRKRTSVCIHIYIYKKCIHIYISIIYRCTPRWQTSIGHSFQNAMDNHVFLGGGDVANQTCHALDGLLGTTRLGNHGSLRWPNGGRLPRIWYVRRMIAMVHYRKPWICFIFKEF